MFYCDPCAEPRGWPVVLLSRSYGPCEICGEKRNCNDVPSSHLPPPKPAQDATWLKEQS